jgi:transcriptional regulator
MMNYLNTVEKPVWNELAKSKNVRDTMIIYTPSHSKVDDQNTLISFIKKCSFASLISAKDSYIEHLTKIPILIKQNEGTLFLEGHIAKLNPHWKFLQYNPDVVVMFDGPHGYVSPTLYTDPIKNVPTWNYSTVIAKGNVEIIQSKDWLIDSTIELSNKYEKDSTWKDNVDTSYVSNLTHGIVGIKIHVTQLEGKFKLSLNQDEESRMNVIQDFEKTNPELAWEMKNT